MPRWACRTILEVTAVKAERLQDISREDAIAEGISVLPLQDANDPSAWWQTAPGENQDRTPVASFGSLWSTIHKPDGPNGWKANPWVWAYTFRRLKK
jgi:hypothetical protein